MSKHTPTPWRIDFESIEENNYGTYDLPLDSENINQFVSVHISNKDPDEEELATAERIVTCVNAMEGLTNEEVTNLRKNADQEKEKVAVAFVEWMATPGLHPEICSFMTPPQKYSYWIKNIYNK